MVHDMIEVEKMGKPAVPLVSGRFEGDAIASSRAFGMPNLKFVIVPRIYRNLAIEDCIKQTEDAFEDIVDTLTAVENSKNLFENKVADTESIYSYEDDDKYKCSLMMNRDLLDRDIGDGFPLLPATRETVNELLEGTSLDANEVVCDMPPGFGIATVEKIAINAAYAGAKPEHMPVLIGAVKAFSRLGSERDPLLSGTASDNQGKSLLMSTSPQAPLLIVNGPLAKDLKINSKSALGPGKDNEVNITIGRAFYLCLKNIGYWYPNEMDMDTIGTTRKFVHCIAENEEMSPWDPFHVDHGFKSNESTVSVFVTDGELDVQDQGNTEAEDLLKVLAYGCTFGTANIQSKGAGGGNERLILMPPDVAGPIGRAGEFSKQKAKEFIHENAVGSLGKMTHYMPLEDARVDKGWQWMKNLTDDQKQSVEISVMNSPDDCYIVVVGADRAKTAVFPSGPAPSIMGIDEFLP
jgi:hypothetical protein